MMILIGVVLEIVVFVWSCAFKKEVQCLKAAHYASARADVPWVPNYIKDIVLGTEKAPDVLVNVAPILAYTREVWIRSDKFCGTESEALGAKELVGIGNEVVQSWDSRGAQDAISRLIESLKFFGASPQNPLRMVTPEGGH